MLCGHAEPRFQARSGANLRYSFVPMTVVRWVLPLCLCAAAVASTRPATAQPSAAAEPEAAEGAAGGPSEDDKERAQRHFQRAKDLYQAGSYREAIAELEAARELDPGAKDLVMNLGIVHEKLGMFDEALGYFQAYLEMEGVSPAEHARAEAIIKRIEGAKRESAASASAVGPRPPVAIAPPPPVLVDEAPPPRGRVDALTITAGSVALAALATGAGFGVYALTSRPEGFVTGRDGSYAELEQKTDSAHTAAIVADIGFGVGAVASLATALLFFGRTKDTTAASRGAAPPARARVSFAGAPSAGVISVDGAF